MAKKKTTKKATRSKAAKTAKKVTKKKSTTKSAGKKKMSKKTSKKARTAGKPSRKKSGAAPVLTHQMIAERAYRVYEQSGYIPGRDHWNWQEAERQLCAELGFS